ncbi:peptidoglycan-binding protein [Halobacteriales archaeon QS_8_69_26]|nr:MAG: peptidoglycan-binding protein [Halobacteriales archaeon QS_8_69_26]
MVEKAEIKILKGKRSGDVIKCRFNPPEYSVKSSVNYEDNKASQNEKSELQFGSRESDQLSMELFFDTSEEQSDVRKKYVEKLTYLTRVDTSYKAPPPVQFVWGSGICFTALVESVDKTFTMFLPDGTPVRARANVTFKEVNPKKYSGGGGGGGGGGSKTHTVKEGDTLWFIAAEKLGDPYQWEAIADENGISDPRELEPGTTLTIPTG